MRISATTLESFRLYMQPDQDWMSEDDLRATIHGQFVPNEKVLLGQAFGRVIETPDAFRVSGGYLVTIDGWQQFFTLDTMAPVLAMFDRRGVFEAKALKAYGPHDVVARADQIIGSQLVETKTTLSSFDFDKYAASCQWRFMADIFQPSHVTYRVFCLSQDSAGMVEVRSIEEFNLFPYAELHRDCCDLVAEFAEFVTAKGWADVLNRRQKEAA